MSEFGRAFDRAQAAYDWQSPSADPPSVEIQCMECGVYFEADGFQYCCNKCKQKQIDNE